MGPGSICTTRIVTGMGVPQLSALSAVVRATDGTDVTVIADGGIKQAGDIAKSSGFWRPSRHDRVALWPATWKPRVTNRINGKVLTKFIGVWARCQPCKKVVLNDMVSPKILIPKKLIAEGV